MDQWEQSPVGTMHTGHRGGPAIVTSHNGRYLALLSAEPLWVRKTYRNSKFGATRCQIDFKAKMHQIRFPLGLRPTPRCGSLQRSPDPLAVIKGPTSRGYNFLGRHSAYSPKDSVYSTIKWTLSVIQRAFECTRLDNKKTKVPHFINPGN